MDPELYKFGFCIAALREAAIRDGEVFPSPMDFMEYCRGLDREDYLELVADAVRILTQEDAADMLGGVKH